MFETKSEYSDFFPLAKNLLERSDRINLVKLLEQPKVRNLFLHNVDHPMGYEDGPSGVSYLRLKKRSGKLTEKDRKKLYEISERVVREVEDDFSQLSQLEKATALLGANQLIQNISWQNYSLNSRDKIRKNLIERISKTYIENPEDIERISKWDAQILENKGFYHLKPNEMTAIGSLMSFIPTMIVAMVFKENPVANFYINNIMPIAMGSMAGIFGHQLALLAQDLPGDKKSPNTTNKLQTKRQYAIQRHPLYFWKGVLGIVPGITSLNPIGLYFASKSAYQLSKACEFQDERMKIIYGQEAEDYQDNVPAFIPSSKILSKGLRKVLPEKVADILDTPVSHYL